MQTDNPLDRRLAASSDKTPARVRDSALFVADTLDVAWAAAQAIFGDKATPDLALAIYDRMAQRFK